MPKESGAIIRKDGFLRLPEVLELIPVSKSSWWRGCKAGIFPPPINLTERTTVWKASDVYDFIDSQTGNRVPNESD